MIIALSHNKSVNLEDLDAEIKAAVPKVTEIKLIAEPRTETINGSVVFKGYDIEVIGDIGAEEQTAIQAAVDAHAPLETTEQARDAARRAARLIEFADIIAEAVRQAKDPK